MPKLIRITTVPVSLVSLLKDQPKFMKAQGFEVIAISTPGELLNEVEAIQGVKTIGIPMTRTISPVSDLKSLWQLYRVFKKERPDIVHSHTPKAGTLGMIAAKLARVPVRMHTIAGLPLVEATGAKRKLLDVVEKITYACAHKIYPNSYGLQDIILKNKYTRAEKLKVIGHGSSNGIDTQEFDPGQISTETTRKLREELGISQENFVFLFVGRVVSDKGVNELVKAFAKITAEKSQIQPHLILVGNYENHLDPLLPETEKTIRENQYIHAVGYKINVNDYLASANVLTFPSYREGFPNVVMQAAAMQLPAIVSDINGCNEIITQGENGWIIPPKNVEKLQERMTWCMQNKTQAKQMGLKSRQLMQEKYERAYVWQELLKEYRNLLANT